MEHENSKQSKQVVENQHRLDSQAGERGLDAQALEARLAQLRRPDGSVPPADRVLDRHYKLSATEFADIQPGRWLNDKVIQTVLRRLTLLRPGMFYALDITTISTISEILDSLPEEDRADFSRPVVTDVAMLTGTEGIVLMPFNVAGSHFILVAVHLGEKAIYIYDSLIHLDENNTPNEVYQNKIRDFVADRVAWLLQFHPESATFVSMNLRGVPCPQQVNSSDCGVSVCLTVLHLISYPENLFSFQRPQFSNGPLFCMVKYPLTEAYWLAGRKLILELCRPYADLSDAATREALALTESTIDATFALRALEFGSRRTEEVYHDAVTQRVEVDGTCSVNGPLLQHAMQVARNAKFYRQVLTSCVRCINSDLTDVLQHTRDLGTEATVDRDLAVQRRARDVVLKPDWEEARAVVVKKAVAYAWHDVEEVRKTRDDLARVLVALEHAELALTFGPQ